MNDAVHYITALCVFGLLTVCLGLDRCKLVWSKVQTGRLHKTEHAGSIGFRQNRPVSIDFC
jgi:hypothetical protein